MWIKIQHDLINMSTVRAVGIGRGMQNKFVLYLPQAEGPETTHIVFESEEEAKAAFAKIEAMVNVVLQFPEPD